MKLHYNTASPFARMVLVTAHEAGVADEIELVRSGTVAPDRINETIAADNPLGKIPCLVTEHGHALYDSRVICEYIAHHGGCAGLYPHEPVRRFRVLTIEALSHGIADAAVLYRYEMVTRPEALRWEAFAERQFTRIHAALDALERQWIGDLKLVTAGSLAAACALSYLDFRHASRPWRDTRPQLAAFYDTFAQRPSMQATDLAVPA